MPFEGEPVDLQMLEEELERLIQQYEDGERISADARNQQLGGMQ